jgi:surface carbohydrate biosynthesis protein (TIGR04326 family)
VPDRGVSVSGNNVDTVLIWDANEPHPSGNHTTVLWRGFSDGASPDIVSIPQLIEENADAIRASYLAWVYELGELRLQGRRLIDHLQLRPGFSYWWMTLFVEKGNYSKSPQITDAIRLLAFTDWAAGNSIARITLVSANQPLAKCLRGWCKKTGIQFEWQRLHKPVESLSWVRRTYAALPLPLQALVWLVSYLKARWPLRGVGLQSWRQTEGRTTFVSYLFNLVPEAAKVGRYESRYWTQLPDAMLNDCSKTNWLHLYMKDELLPDAHQAANIISRFNDAGRGAQNHVTLDTFLGVRVVLRALKDWGQLVWHGKRLQPLISSAAQDAPDLWPLFVGDWRQSMSGITALSNTLNLSLFEAAMQFLPRQEVGVYLQENQGWEFALIHAWKDAAQGRLIGTPHSSVRFWDLRYFFDPRSYLRDGKTPLPLPDQIALNGQAATDAYLAGSYPVEDLIQVEALRYLYLNDAKVRPIAPVSSSSHRLRLLVLGDYLASQTRLQMRLLAQAATSLPAGTIITVKPHPACPIRAEDYPGLQMTIVTEPIANVLAECDVAYTSAVTSAAVDAYCVGLPVVSVLDPTTLNMSPLRGYDHVFYASTADEVIRRLNSALTAPRADAIRGDLFTVDTTLSRWRQLLNHRSIETTINVNGER